MALTVAAVDLGSNSFHMVIARFVEHDLDVLDRIKEPVRLADGLDDDGGVTPEAEARAIECLQRFGERVRNLPSSQVRAVGTNSLRKARKSRGFRARLAKALGHPIEVVSGREEARLIYSGVANTNAHDDAPRLVVDIGGGSTEMVIGRGFDPVRAESLYMGCVTFSKRFFGSGSMDRDAFRKAETAAGLELRSSENAFRKTGWTTALGASGTVKAIADLLRRQDGAAEITLGGLKKLRQALCSAGKVDGLQLDGLSEDRAPVLPGGLAILIAIFKRLEVAGMTPSSGALREGVLYDLVGRMQHEDVRDRTIERWSAQFQVDLPQAERVERAALHLLGQVQEGWGTGDVEEHLLRWAARLHEIGLAVSYSGNHKHGAYLAANGEMPGFSADDQERLAALIRGHRRRVPRELFAELGTGGDERAFRLCLLLRLAVLLNRTRSTEHEPTISGDPLGGGLHLEFPEGWLDEHPLTRADLEREVELLNAVGVSLDYR